MNDHNCVTHDQNQLFHGLTILCSACLKIWYLGCLPEDQDVKQLLKILGLTGVNATSDTAKLYAYNSLRLLFNNDSMFSFICPACKSNDNTFSGLKTINEKLTDKIKDLKTANKKKDDKIKELNEEVKMIKSQANQNEKSTKNNVNEIIEPINNVVRPENDGISSQMQMDVDTIDNERPLTYSDIEQMLKTFNSKICSEVKELLQNNNAQNDEKVAKKRKFNKITDGFLSQQTPLFISDNVNNLDKNEQENDKLKRPQLNDNNGLFKNSKLKPPVKQISQGNGIFEIHVSKFASEVDESDISEHIMQNTTVLVPELYTIEELKSQKDNRLYKSFKITTLKKHVYDEIINEQLWAPEFKARNFIALNNTKLTTDKGRAQNRFTKQMHKEVNFETPKTGRSTFQDREQKSYQRKNFRNKFDSRNNFNRNRNYDSRQNQRPPWQADKTPNNRYANNNMRNENSQIPFYVTQPPQFAYCYAPQNQMQQPFFEQPQAQVQQQTQQQ